MYVLVLNIQKENGNFGRQYSRENGIQPRWKENYRGLKLYDIDLRVR